MLTASREIVVDETVRRKTSLVEKCLPVSSVIDFGGMWEVNGYYSKLCKDKFGIKQVTMIDNFESRAWKKNLKLREGIDFRRGDFSCDDFMIKIGKRYDLALAYDVLPHQIDLRHTLSLMLSKTKKFFLVSQPILPDELMPFPNSNILLSGSNSRELIPFQDQWTRRTRYWRNFFDATNTDSSHWQWAMTPSFLESLMKGFGWKLTHKEFWRGWLPRSKWRLCGLIFKNAKA